MPSSERSVLGETMQRAVKHVITRCGKLVWILLLTMSVGGQENYVGRWDAYGGYTYISQPNINLGENGFNLQTGVRLTTWLTGGFDYSVATGQNTLLEGML